jgi:hypothetical protein
MGDEGCQFHVATSDRYERGYETGGGHLILVRYSAGHIDKSDECVYNSADIDAAKVVWAQDMGQAKNRELIDYYKGSRRTWLYQPDVDPPKLTPYESTSQ